MCETDLSLGDIASLVTPEVSDQTLMNEWSLPYKLPPQTNTPVAYDLWESLAYDLVLSQAPLSEVARAYGVSEAAIDDIQKNPYFAKLLSSKHKEVQEAGGDAQTKTRFRMIASLGMREFTRRLTSANTSDKDFHSLFRTALEMAELLPDKPTGGIVIGAGSGTTFNLYSIPGLEHLSGASQTPVIEEAEVSDPVPTVLPTMEAL